MHNPQTDSRPCGPRLSRTVRNRRDRPSSRLQIVKRRGSHPPYRYLTRSQLFAQPAKSAMPHGFETTSRSVLSQDDQRSTCRQHPLELAPFAAPPQILIRKSVVSGLRLQRPAQSGTRRKLDAQTTLVQGQGREKPDHTHAPTIDPDRGSANDDDLASPLRAHNETRRSAYWRHCPRLILARRARRCTSSGYTVVDLLCHRFVPQNRPFRLCEWSPAGWEPCT